MYKIDYHRNDLCDQIEKMMGESIINRVLDTTIRFVTEMIHAEIKKDGLTISVNILQQEYDMMLVFRYQCRQYAPILNAEDKASHIDDFFNYYFDDIHHDYTDGENTLIFRFTMMSNADIKKKYLDALDKNYMMKIKK